MDKLKKIAAIFGVLLLWMIWLAAFERGVSVDFGRWAGYGRWKWSEPMGALFALILFVSLMGVTYRFYLDQKRYLAAYSVSFGVLMVLMAIMSSLVSYVSRLPPTEVTREESTLLRDVFAANESHKVDLSTTGYSLFYAKNRFLILSKDVPSWLHPIPLRSRHLIGDRSVNINGLHLGGDVEKLHSELHYQILPYGFKKVRAFVTDSLVSKGGIESIESQHGTTFHDNGKYPSDFVRYLNWRYPGKIFAVIYFEEGIELESTSKHKLTITAPVDQLSEPRGETVKSMYAVDIDEDAVPYNLRMPDDFIESTRDSVHSARGPMRFLSDLQHRFVAYRDVLKLLAGVDPVQEAVQASGACWVDAEACTSLAEASQAFYQAVEQDNAEAVDQALQQGFLTEDQITFAWELALEHQAASTAESILKRLDAERLENLLDKSFSKVVKSNHPGLVRVVLSQDIDFQRETNRKVAFWAIENGNPEVVEQLLAGGMPPDLTDYYHRQPLHLAARKGRKEVINLLLQYGADVNAMDRNGQSALNYAVADEYQADILLMLIQVPELIVEEAVRQEAIDNLKLYIKATSPTTAG